MRGTGRGGRERREENKKSRGGVKSEEDGERNGEGITIEGALIDNISLLLLQVNTLSLEASAVVVAAAAAGGAKKSPEKTPPPSMAFSIPFCQVVLASGKLRCIYTW